MKNSTEELEAGRLQAAKKLKNVRLAGISTYIITIFCPVAAYSGPSLGRYFPRIPEEYFFWFYIIAIIAFGIFIWRSLVCFSRSMVAYNEYNEYVKEKIVLPVLSEAVTVVKYEPDDYLSEVTIEESGLFRDFFYVRGNDLLEAIYKDRHFRICDLRLREGTEDRRSLSYVSKFKGRFIILDSENYADPFELKTRISDRIERFSENTGDKIKVSFSDGKVYIAWHCRDYISEADFFAKTDTSGERERAVAGIKQVTDFLDCLPEKLLY